jgi:hypothetical protein
MLQSIDFVPHSSDASEFPNVFYLGVFSWDGSTYIWDTEYSKIFASLAFCSSEAYVNEFLPELHDPFPSV